MGNEMCMKKEVDTQTEHLQVMELKYDREWEPVYQAFLLLPLVQVAPANPVTEPHKHKTFHYVA